MRRLKFIAVVTLTILVSALAQSALSGESELQAAEAVALVDVCPHSYCDNQTQAGRCVYTSEPCICYQVSGQCNGVEACDPH